MPNRPFLPGSPTRRRVRREVSTVESPTGMLTSSSEETTEIAPDGSFETIKITRSQMIDGLHVISLESLAGQCDRCQRYVLPETIRFCSNCGIVLCRRCARLDREAVEEDSFLCPICAKLMKRRRAWKIFWRTITSPFVERSDS